MALIKCPECGKDISNHSTKCINCGYPLKPFVTDKNENFFLASNETNTDSPIFSNKDRANQMQTIMCCICIPLLIVGVFMSSPINYIFCGIVLIVSLCMAPSISYIEVFSDKIEVRTSYSKARSIKIKDITSVTRGEKQIIVYVGTTKYVANCGDDCETIIAYINKVKSA